MVLSGTLDRLSGRDLDTGRQRVAHARLERGCLEAQLPERCAHCGVGASQPTSRRMQRRPMRAPWRPVGLPV
jgi:hypothetical protein